MGANIVHVALGCDWSHMHPRGTEKFSCIGCLLECIYVMSGVVPRNQIKIGSLGKNSILILFYWAIRVLVLTEADVSP